MTKPTQHLEMMSDTQYPIWMPTTALDAVMPVIRKRETTGYVHQLTTVIIGGNQWAAMGAAADGTAVTASPTATMP